MMMLLKFSFLFRVGHLLLDVGEGLLEGEKARAF